MTCLYLDLDGTLLDVSERYHRIYHDIMASCRQPVLSRAHYWECKRQRLSEFQIFSQTAVDGARFVYYQEARQRLIEDPSYLSLDRPIISNLHQVLKDLAKRHCLFLVTLRNNRDLLHDQLKDLGLFDYFNAVLSPLSTRPRDTSDWRLKAGLIHKNGLQPLEAFIIGDTEADILAGKAVGLRTCAVLSGLRDMDYLCSLNPDFLIDNVSHLSDQL